MNKQECAKVLAKIQLGDNRQVTSLVLDEWFDTIGHLGFDDAIQAVRMHRQESTEYLVAAHIVALVRRIGVDRNQRAAIESKRPAPKPLNYEAIAAAWNDPEELRRQYEIYDQQLRDAGYEP